MNTVKFEIMTTPGVWMDVSADVYQRDGLTITRGRSDQQSQSEPQSASFTLENRDGKYSARNPMSPLYGVFGRNTPVRITENSTFMRFYGEMTQTQIAERIGLSQMHVSRLLTRILKRLRAEVLEPEPRPSISDPNSEG